MRRWLPRAYAELTQAGKNEAQKPAVPVRAHKANPLKSSGGLEGARKNRRNEAKLAAKQKRAALVDSTRVFQAAPTTSGLRGEAASVHGEARGRPRGWRAGAPRICAVVALTPDVDAWDAIRQLERDGEALGVQPVPERGVEDAMARRATFCELESTRFRQTMQFLPLPYGALHAAMDACSAADFVILLLSSQQSIEPGSWGELCLRSLQAHGMPHVLAAVPTLQATDEQPWSNAVSSKSHTKDSQGVRKSLASFVQYFCPEVKKVHVLDEAADRSVLVRSLGTAAPKRVAWRDFRAWVHGEDAEWIGNEPDSAPSPEARGTLKVCGWIRGIPLSANRLVHIPDYGDFVMDRITYAPLADRRRHVRQPNPGEAMEEDAKQTGELVPGAILDERDEEADELVSENEPDTMANEQTWPTEEEMADAPAARDMDMQTDAPPPARAGTTPRTITKKQVDEDARRRYEAAWDEAAWDEDDEEEEDEEEDDEELMSDTGADMDEEEDEEDEEDEAPEEADQGEDEIDEDQERAAIEEFRQQQQREREERKEEQADAQFPDEIDTPLTIPARERFARYRGLESLYTSYWDPYEDLPEDYARLFQFDDFSKTRKRVESSALFEGVPPGVRACLWIRDVPFSAAERAVHASGTEAPAGKKKENVPFVVFGLLRHEHKKSVVNFTVTRNTEYDAPVRSKDPLVVCLGFRRYQARPVYSQHVRNVGGRSNNVYKFERFLPHGIGAAVGSVYAPVTFGGANVPVVLFRQRSETKEFGYDDQGVSAEQTPHLVGSGTLLDVAPTRIIAKRIILSGHPYKLHKKTATIRFMFFNADDVRYFAPVTLRTKYGRTGHIRESLGTHGYYKAHFDGPLTQMDTVLMSLYKRVYPRWSTPFQGGRDGMPLVE